MIAPVFAALFLLVGETLATSSAAPSPAVTTKPEAKQNHPWYVKAASDQVVQFCWVAGMWDGFKGGVSNMMPYRSVNGAAATISFSSLFTETMSVNTATTLYTTIPGSVVTIYGGSHEYMSSKPPQTFSTVIVPTTTDPMGAVTGTMTSGSDNGDPTDASAPSSTSSGIVQNVHKLNNYAHALAEAVVAPAQMTGMLSSAYNAIMEHGFIHGSQAVELISQASEGFKALQTDPAYAAQSKKLAAQPTPINFQRAVAKATQSHSAGMEKLLADPSGKKAIVNAKELGESFMKAFIHER